MHPYSKRNDVTIFRKIISSIIVFPFITMTTMGLTTIAPMCKNRMNLFNGEQRPILALITEPDTLSSNEKMEHALQQISKVQSTIDFLSIRINSSDSTSTNYDNMLHKFLVSIKQQQEGNPLKVIVHHDNNLDAILKNSEYINGIHIKERDIKQLLPILKEKNIPKDWFLGTSLHSLSSANCLTETMQQSNIYMDYVYVGTCFETKSHPGKQILEGPTLPGEIKSFLHSKKHCCPVLAIGGITPDNCHIPIQHGADGVAAIRCIMQAQDDDPMNVALKLKHYMKQEQECI